MSKKPAQEKELMPIDKIKPGELFAGIGLDDMLKNVSTQARKLIPDIETAKGRKELASFAHKIAKSKTALDLLGKNHVDATKKELKKFDANRKKAKDFLTDLQVEIRKPLTEWEEAEAKKAKDIVDSIEAIKDLVPDSHTEATLENIKLLSVRLEKARKFKAGKKYGEMASIAIQARDDCIAVLQDIVSRLKTQVEEKAELDKLRAESEAQQKKDREIEIARQATEQAEAESAAKEQKAIDDKVAAEKREKEAVAAAQLETEQAAQRERDKIAAEQKAVDDAAKKREADTKHNGEVHSEILAALLKHCSKAGLTEKAAKKVIAAMAGKAIPHVTINY